MNATKALRLSNVNQLLAYVLRDAGRFKPQEVLEARLCNEVCTRLPHWTALPDDPEPWSTGADATHSVGCAAPDYAAADGLTSEHESAMEDSSRAADRGLTAKQVRRQLFWDDDSSAEAVRGRKGGHAGGGSKKSQTGSTKSRTGTYQPRQTSYNGTYTKIGTLDSFGDPVLIRDNWDTSGVEDEWDQEPRNFSLDCLIDVGPFAERLMSA